ncbi:hypothetical protein P8C59_009236 [Phyllachora maydis]|uniref:Ras-related protein RSR1 n=1 Tax=Phyllachora maydis TaxID=1825666 RepID=A0AAD9MJG6_9PEZI|nr:hypothetical protein P8C59_009236 [Phyllachora maydis]
MGSAERSEVDIYSVFNIMSGTEMGGCDAYLDELTAWFHDCVELVDAASTCANSPKWEDAEYRRGYFHLSPDQDVEPITGPIHAVRRLLQGRHDWWREEKALIFCSSGWRERQQWTDKSRTSRWRDRGRTNEEVVGKKRALRYQEAGAVPFWSDLLQKLFISPPLVECGAPHEDPSMRTMGFVTELDCQVYVTLCVKDHRSNNNELGTLADIAPITSAGVSMATEYVRSMLLFHELFHVVRPRWSDSAYGLEAVLGLEAVDKTTENPDSYMWFALACWLGQRYKRFQFAHGESALLESTGSSADGDPIVHATPTPYESRGPIMPTNYPAREFHVVVLGAGGVGKSCITAQFVHNEWIESYDPTIEDSYRTQIAVDERQVVLEILDTAGTEQFVAMRDLYMKTGQGFLLVFSITSTSSLKELEMLRDEIIRIKDDKKIPIVLVGNKCDLADQRQVDRARAFSIAQQWGCPYYEASARTRTNIDEIFADLSRQIIRKGEWNQDPDDGPDVRSSAAAAANKRRCRKRREHRCYLRPPTYEVIGSFTSTQPSKHQLSA